MKMNVITALAVCLSCNAAMSAELFVSPSGKDTNPGNRQAPFATLERARDAIRNLKAAGRFPEEGVTVTLRGGAYERTQAFRLEARDSGNDGAPVIYQGDPAEQVVLTGARRIPARGLVSADPAFTGKIIKPAARRHILEIDLKTYVSTGFGDIASADVVDASYAPAPVELFVDDQLCELARFPNRHDDYSMLGFIGPLGLDGGEKDKEGHRLSYDTLSTGANFFSSGSDDDVLGWPAGRAAAHVKRWSVSNAPYVGGGLVRSYSHRQRRISSIDPKTGAITLADPVRLWKTWGQKSVFPVFFFNVPEELDQPGEYYIDRASGKAYLYPPQTWSDESVLSVSVLNEPVISLNGTSNIRLRNLTIEGTRTIGVTITRGANNLVERCAIRQCGIAGAMIGVGYDPVTARELPDLPGAYRSLLTVRLAGHPEYEPQLGASAFNRQGGTNNGFDGCHIYLNGAGGVYLGGGDRKTLSPAGNFVRNCNIHHTGRRTRLYAENIVMDGVGNLVQGNYLHHGEGALVFLLGNNHTIEYNEMAHGILTGLDAGVIYSNQNPTMLGNRIRYNYIHDNGRDGNPQLFGIYLDNTVYGFEVYGNVLANNLLRSVTFNGKLIAITGGHLNRIENNIFVDNTAGVVGGGDDFERTQNLFAGGYGRAFVADLDVTKSPFSTSYPEFVELYQKVRAKDPTAPLGNSVINNLAVGNGSPISGGKFPGMRRGNWETDVDPGFVNAAHHDYTLRPDSVVFQKIPGFQPIPFEKMRQAQKWKNHGLPASGPSGN